MSQPERHPSLRVFISYSHDSEKQKEQVLQLSEQLRSDGVDCWIDQYEVAGGPTEGWPKWIQNQIEKADFVLAVCTESYSRHFTGQEESEKRKGKGVSWNGAFLTQELYENSQNNTRVRAILLEDGDEIWIPTALREFTWFKLPEGYENLYRMLTDQPHIAPPRLGEIKTLEKKPLNLSRIKPLCIQSLRINNIKCFKKVALNFSAPAGANLLLGTNARGKSTILQLISLGLLGIEKVPFPYSWKQVVRQGATNGSFELDLLIEKEMISLQFEVDNKDRIHCLQGGTQLEERKKHFFLLGFGANRHVKVEDPTQEGSIEPVATLFGENGFLKHIQKSETYQVLLKDFNSIQTLINQILHQADPEHPVSLEEYDTQSFWFHTSTNPNGLIPLEALSEGFKSTFVWLFDMMVRIIESGTSLDVVREISGVVLVDEIDLHLHPSWQRTIIQSISGVFPNLQFIVTTHSPFITQSVIGKSIFSLELNQSDELVTVVQRELTNELSYEAIIREFFGISYLFSYEIEQKIKHFHHWKQELQNGNNQNEKKFYKLAKDLSSRGEELKGSVYLEIRSLEQKLGKEFNLWKK